MKGMLYAQHSGATLVMLALLSAGNTKNTLGDYKGTSYSDTAYQNGAQAKHCHLIAIFYLRTQ